jgi:hypothetical protein
LARLVKARRGSVRQTVFRLGKAWLGNVWLGNACLDKARRG